MRAWSIGATNASWSARGKRRLISPIIISAQMMPPFPTLPGNRRSTLTTEAVQRLQEGGILLPEPWVQILTPK